MKSRTAIRQQIQKLERASKLARDLSNALNALDDSDRAAALYEMLRREGCLETISHSEYLDRRQQLDEYFRFVTRLGVIRPEQRYQFRQGRPRNIPALLILRDAAAIFEWFSGERAEREVVRGESKESGRFFNFASELWPLVFGNGQAGLSAAMKNWAWARRRYDEASALIANINFRHPTWGVFET